MCLVFRRYPRGTFSLAVAQLEKALRKSCFAAYRGGREALLSGKLKWVPGTGDHVWCEIAAQQHSRLRATRFLDWPYSETEQWDDAVGSPWLLAETPSSPNAPLIEKNREFCLWTQINLDGSTQMGTQFCMKFFFYAFEGLTEEHFVFKPPHKEHFQCPRGSWSAYGRTRVHPLWASPIWMSIAVGHTPETWEGGWPCATDHRGPVSWSGCIWGCQSKQFRFVYKTCLKAEYK